MRRRDIYRFLCANGTSIFLGLALLMGGCTRTPPPQPPLPAPPIFPPQRVMESGNYAEFLAENEGLLQKCQGGGGCDVVLFNLGFTYAYAPNPQRDLGKALQYFNELRSQYPQSPWAIQGQAWSTLIAEQHALEESQRKLQTELRSKDATIRNLQGRLNRSREIDIEMQKKERELLR